MTEKEKCEHEFGNAEEPCYCDLSNGTMTNNLIPHSSHSCTHCGTDECVFIYTEDLRQQTRKETAKEILECIEGQGRISHHLVLERIELTADEWKNIKKKYGVGA